MNENVMKKDELVAKIAEKNGLTKKKAKEVISSIVEEIIDSLSKGRGVYIAGLGTWTVDTSLKKRKDLESGEEVICIRKSTKFSCDKKMMANSEKQMAANVEFREVFGFDTKINH